MRIPRHPRCRTDGRNRRAAWRARRQELWTDLERHEKTHGWSEDNLPYDRLAEHCESQSWPDWMIVFWQDVRESYRDAAPR